MQLLTLSKNCAYDFAAADGDLLFAGGEDECVVLFSGKDGEGEYGSCVGVRFADEYAELWEAIAPNQNPL